jgi:hypothetical protein
MNTANLHLAGQLQLEQLPNKTWIWYHQAASGRFDRSPKAYKTRAAADKAGQQWLSRRANPRNRGR